MTRRLSRLRAKNVLAPLVALYAAAAVAQPVLAKDCPVTIDDFYFTSLGETRGLALYQVGLLSGASGPVSIRFDVDDNGVTSSRTVNAANVDFEFQPKSLELQSGKGPSAKIVFAWPSKNVSAVAIREISLASSNVVKCNTGWTPLTRPGLMQTAWRFDDLRVNLGSEVSVSVVTEPKFIRRVYPEYPEGAKEHGIQGDVTVEILLDESGKLIDSWVIKSSGDLLDQASLNAARASTYHAPMAFGQPIVATFTIDYVFELR